MAGAFYVYILAGDNRELYIGITKHLLRRIAEHRRGADPYGHAFRHDITRLVYAEPAESASQAMRRERELSGWSRKRKVALIRRANPEWHDLSAAWRLR